MKTIHENTIITTALAADIPIRLAELILAQAKHETNNFTSNVFKHNNNAFGYKYVKNAKYQYGGYIKSPEGDKYAKYTTVANSTKEIIAWIQRRLKEKRFPNLNTITTPEQYALWLKSTGYYTDTIENYANGLKKYYKEQL